MLSDDENPIFFKTQNQNENIMSQLLNECNQSLKEANEGEMGKQYLQDDRESIRSIKLDLSEDQQIFTKLLQKPYQQKLEEDCFLLGSSAQKKTTNESHLGIKGLVSSNCKALFQEEPRAIKIQRYKQKKVRRVWDRKVQYQCRKVVADNRVRVKGRFIKNQSLASTPQPPKNREITLNQCELEPICSNACKLQHQSAHIL